MKLSNVSLSGMADAHPARDTTMAAAADPRRFDEILPWDQRHKLGGIYFLLAVEDPEVRAWAVD
ncbi:MAG: hypothetical protein ACPID7_03540, partial [Candidatus Puniceispirillum sp.]